MRVGLGHIGISPKDFWEYSLKEWLLTIEGYNKKTTGVSQDDVMSRTRLDELMQEYPDGNRNTT